MKMINVAKEDLKHIGEIMVCSCFDINPGKSFPRGARRAYQKMVECGFDCVLTCVPRKKK